MALLQQFIEQSKKLNRTVVLPEGNDERILAAAVALQKDGIARPVVLGKRDEITAVAARIGADIGGLTVVEPAASPDLPELVKLYCEKRKNISASVAERLVKRDLMFGGMLVAAGKADTMVAGAANPTASVIQAASLTIGYQAGISTASSFFIMVLPDGKILFYADCAVNIDPTTEQLAEIGIATARSYQRIMKADPRTAFLSFSSKGSAAHAFVDKVSGAVKAAGEKCPELAFDGEFQADTALSETVAAKKLKEPGRVAGRANVLIFPDLDAGNVAYKLTQYLAKADALGPILQGFARPVSDLSRGAKVQDIIGVVAITCVQA